MPDTAANEDVHVDRTARRTFVFHYHLFKNAGTSIDEILRQNFGTRWAEQEFPGSGAKRSNVEAVTAWLREHPELQAFSSHTALLPVPVLENVDVFPILFVRHPIDRLRSAYVFERAQAADTPGARLAKEHDFAGYLRELLKPQKKHQARNFQTFRLAFNEPFASGTDLERAIRALEKLPFVGMVEEFDRSIHTLELLLRPIFPELSVVIRERNVSRSRADSLDERLADVQKQLGDDLFSEICVANADDLAIYRIVARRYAI